MKSDKIVGRPIRLNKCTLHSKSGKNHVDVMFISDVHLGSPQCDKVRFLGNLEWCLKYNYYVMLGGDLLETANRHSVGSGVYEQEFPCQTQYEQMIEWLRPLAQRKLILGSHRGNHEERVYKETGIDISKALCRELSIPYLGDACWSQFVVGKETYNIYSLQGRSNARFDGTALLAVARNSTSFNADLTAHSHMHKCANSIVVMQKTRNGIVGEQKKHLLITGGYLKYDNSYASAVGLPISKLGSPRVKFFSDKHDISISW